MKQARVGDHLIRQLLARVAAGDARAFDALHSRTHGKMMRTALLILRHREEAEDVVQDAFLKIWRHAASFRPLESFSAISWMARIVRNTAIDAVRARRPPSDEVPEDLADSQPNPEQLMSTAQRARHVAILLSRLDEKKRIVVQGAYVGGHSYLNLSRQLGMPLNTVRTRLRRGLLDLQELASAAAAAEDVARVAIQAAARAARPSPAALLATGA